MMLDTDENRERSSTRRDGEIVEEVFLGGQRSKPDILGDLREGEKGAGRKIVNEQEMLDT